jgi:hypothetical protein
MEHPNFEMAIDLIPAQIVSMGLHRRAAAFLDSRRARALSCKSYIAT